ncbi:hypothetical protein C2G38_2028065 [Gigaspora rosea]|uniref:MATH domain-containing protein n=1 Tax=Gigaspora rosea TaxID=44941 RepID=A0A397W2Q6_9GLOM|nr:hypothetical protein C2G38_2028065 [Gigaspora rosea]
MDYEAVANKILPNLGHKIKDFQYNTWHFTNWNNAERKLIGPEFEVGGCKWCTLVYPFGTTNLSKVSIYLKFINSPEAYSCTQFAFILWNSEEPTQYIKRYSYYRFTAKQPNWGFAYFCDQYELFIPSHSRTRPLIENNSCNITTFVRVLEDPTDIQLNVKGCITLEESFDSYVQETLEGDNKYEAEGYGLQLNQRYKFPMEIDLQKYLSQDIQDVDKSKSYKYLLHGIKFNNSEVTKVSNEVVLENNYIDEDSNVVTEEIFKKHKGFDFVNFDNKQYPLTEVHKFEVLKNDTYEDFKKKVSEKFEILPNKMKFWIITSRSDGTFRPQELIFEDKFFDKHKLITNYCYVTINFKIHNGDIICFQKTLTNKEIHEHLSAGRLYNIPQFYESISMSTIVLFRSKFGYKDPIPEFSLVLNKNTTLNTVANQVAVHINIDPLRLRFTPDIDLNENFSKKCQMILNV